MAKADLTAERLRELLHYDPETGIFIWRVNIAHSRSKSGATAGNFNQDGYRIIGIGRRSYCAGRLAWLYIHGCWPTKKIDHRNGQVSDNKITNLRDVSTSVNGQNQRKAMSSNYSCGLLGVTFNKRAKKWQASIELDGKSHYIGLFQSPVAAHTAYLSAKRILHEGCTI